MKINTRTRNLVLFTFIGAMLFLFFGYKKDSSVQLTNKTEKQRGAHVFGITSNSNITEYSQWNMDWITLVSWGYQENTISTKVAHHRGDSVQIQKHNQHWINHIKRVKQAGYKVFFKPHLWLINPEAGMWRSDIYPLNESNWLEWQHSYTDFIIRYAKVAEKAKADMFCIGVECTRLTKEKPLFWKNLIAEVRKVYSGKLTYAANWYEEFEVIDFWGELDYIGVQAYFPLANTEKPTYEDIKQGWQKYLPLLEGVSTRYQKQIVFTEMGYKSMKGAAIKPWEWIEKMKESTIYDPQIQAFCYQSFFEQIWPKSWFAGMHLWQIRHDYFPDLTSKNLDFTPQGKPAENIIKQGYKSKL